MFAGESGGQFSETGETVDAMNSLWGLLLPINQFHLVEEVY